MCSFNTINSLIKSKLIIIINFKYIIRNMISHQVKLESFISRETILSTLFSFFINMIHMFKNVLIVTLLVKRFDGIIVLLLNVCLQVESHILAKENFKISYK